MQELFCPVQSATLTNTGHEVKEVVSEGSDTDDSEKDDVGTVSKSEIFSTISQHFCSIIF